MENSGKKISFGFSKVKKPAINNSVKARTPENVEYVDCFDGDKGKFTYKGIARNDSTSKHELVIPLITTKTSTDIKARIGKNSSSDKEKNGDCPTVGANTSDENKITGSSGLSIDEIAAAEILNNIRASKGEGEKLGNLVILQENPNEKESVSEGTIDYEQVPVSDFGMAMLRGMGWKPNAGIGKEPRLVTSVSPKLRPKGLGLGAKTNLETNVEQKSS